MNGDYLISAAVTGFITFVFTWGAMRKTVSDVEKRLADCEGDLKQKQIYIQKTREQFAEQVHNLHEVYVSRAHFNETMAMIRDNYRELKDDVKKILDFISRPLDR